MAIKFEFAEKFGYKSPWQFEPDIKGVFIEKISGPGIVCEGCNYTFKVEKVVNSKLLLSDLAEVIKWGYSVDGGDIIPIVQRTLREKARAYLFWRIPKTKNAQRIRVYAWVHEPSKDVSVDMEIRHLPFLFDQFRIKGLNSDSTRIADDMCYGNGVDKTDHFRYTIQDIENLNPLMKFTLKFKELDLWLSLQRMVAELFSIGELEKVALKMIQNFRNNKGTEFSDPVLAKHVIRHETTIDFCKNIGMQGLCFPLLQIHSMEV